MRKKFTLILIVLGSLIMIRSTDAAVSAQKIFKISVTLPEHVQARLTPSLKEESTSTIQDAPISSDKDRTDISLTHIIRNNHPIILKTIILK